MKQIKAFSTISTQYSSWTNRCWPICKCNWCSNCLHLRNYHWSYYKTIFKVSFEILHPECTIFAIKIKLGNERVSQAVGDLWNNINQESFNKPSFHFDDVVFGRFQCQLNDAYKADICQSNLWHDCYQNMRYSLLLHLLFYSRQFHLDLCYHSVTMGKFIVKKSLKQRSILFQIEPGWIYIHCWFCYLQLVHSISIRPFIRTDF